ncbi:uncharacterized protein UHOD_11842 [Ustilago sp. UG-2017b]|nr:uncharacterized protein UHOD_11842 [Ustilago sp. UG-2017b]
MTTSNDNSLDISAQLFWQFTTPTSSATQTESVPALSQSGSTSAPDIHTSCPTRASRSATGKKNFTWLGANVLHLVTILYNSESYQHALLPSQESAESNPALKLRKHPIFREISKLIFPGASVEHNRIKAKLSSVALVARHDQYQYEGDGEVGGVDEDTKVWYVIICVASDAAPALSPESTVRGLAPETQVGLLRYAVTIKLRDDSGWRSWSGVSVDDDEYNGVGDEVGGVGGNSVASTRVSSVLTNA